MKAWKGLGLLLIGAMVFAVAGCGGNGNSQDPASNGKTNAEKEQKWTDVKVVLDWTPNTNHTGLYVARDKGYYEEQGLHVEIIQPSGTGGEQMVASGAADFGVSYQEAVSRARIEGVPLVSIAAVIQHNTSGFASPVDKNIRSPKDFEGKTYGGWGSPEEPAVLQFLMEKEQADFSKLKIINIGETDYFTAVKRDIDFAWIYNAWTGVEAQLRNESLNMIYLTDYSDELDYYTPVLATSEKMIRDKPDLVRAFMAATAKGYQFAIDHPEDAANVLIEAEPDLNKKLVKASQQWLSPRYQDDADQWGIQKSKVWNNYTHWLQEHELMDRAFDPTEAFTNDFLPKP